MRLTVVSYNIHQCLGRDGRCDPARIAAVLGATEADIIGLQEVGDCSGQLHHSEQLQFLAQATQLHAIAGPTLLRGEVFYGNGLLTRKPVKSVPLHDLSVAGREPRGAIDAILELGHYRVRVITTHFGLSMRERQRQAQQVLGLLQNSADLNADVVVVMGDLNEWRPRGILRTFLQHFSQTRFLATFPAHFPLLALDRIWVSPGAHCVTWDVLNMPLAQVASDHLPLRAVLHCPS